MNDIYNYIRGVIQNALEENEDFPRMWEFCRKCVNSTGHSCKAYDTENPDIAVEKCAKDGFRNYMF